MWGGHSIARYTYIPLQDLSNNTKGTSQFLLLELNGRHSSVTTSSTDFSFQNLVFWNLFEFSVAEIT
jgi:hypothetical protein